MVLHLRLWIVGAAVGFAVGLYVWVPERPRPCRATFERVHTGMTRAEVVATVGGPPGIYSDGKAMWAPDSPKSYPHEGWLGPDSQLIVRFDEDDRADNVVISGVILFADKLTLWEDVRQYLGF